MSDTHYTKQRINGKYKYTYTCVKCNEQKTITYIPKPNPKCAKCTQKELVLNMIKHNIKKEEDKKRYTHTCPSCGLVRVCNRKYKTEYCSKCSSKRIGESNRVSKKNETNNDKPVKNNTSKKPKKVAKKTPKKVSSKAIEKEREKNRKHRENVNKNKEVEKKIPKQQLTDEQMIKAFYKKKKPSVIDTVKKTPHLVGTTYIKGYDM